jgi:exopolysaccharide biosynthesis polyprenyl glycosylphosphotransferase
MGKARPQSTVTVETESVGDRMVTRAEGSLPAAESSLSTGWASLPVSRVREWASVSANRRDAVYRRVLILADASAATASLLITRAIVGPGHPRLGALVAVPLIVVMSKVVGIYDRQDILVRKSTLDEAPVLFELATMYALIVWLLNGFIITQSSNRRELLVDWAVLLCLLLIFHVAARCISRRLTRPERCLVIGDREMCDRIRLKLASRPSLHAVVVAYIPIEPVGDASLADGLELSTIAAQEHVDRIIVVPEMTDAEEVLNLIRAASGIRLKVSVVPRMLEVVGSSVEFDDVEGVPLLCMRSIRLNRSSRAVKRSLDITLSAVGLVLLSPLLAVIALAIKLDSRGPVLFRQLRVGRNARPFEMLKFRTMVGGAHERREELRHLNEADGLFKIASDPRVTRVGSFLRRLSIDELPQLFNVVRGDMSLVGPRPLIVEEDQRIHGWHRRRLQLTPGMTGHWQILGSARIPLHEMVKIDYLYVTNWSLWNDVKILIRTVPYVIGRRGM